MVVPLSSLVVCRLASFTPLYVVGILPVFAVGLALKPLRIDSGTALLTVPSVPSLTPRSLGQTFLMPYPRARKGVVSFRA